MSDIAGIAGNAVMAYQNALATVSNNIANVATDGYSRQDATLTALPVTPAGNFFLGSGVIVGTVKRQYDAFVESNLRNTTSDLAAQGPMVSYANRVVDVMEELVKFTLLTRGVSGYLVDRYSERKEALSFKPSVL